MNYVGLAITSALERESAAKIEALRREFEKRLEDPEFARNPAARLEFFYRRHSSWDERLNLYPVFRTTGTPQARRRKPLAALSLTS